VHADLDHTVGWAVGGRTAFDNLGAACRHHHRLKGEGGWTLEQPRPGVFLWSSADGRAYRNDTTTNDSEGNLPERDHDTWASSVLDDVVSVSHRTGVMRPTTASDMCPF
jgi:hypothetical protein